MRVRHKHSDEIIAWANGEQIQFYDETRKKWTNVQEPSWYTTTEYRIKPEFITLNDIDNNTLKTITFLYTPNKKYAAKILDTNFRSGYKNLTILAKVIICDIDELILINRNTGTYKFLDERLHATEYFVYYDQN